ncbi:hypothetical protein Mgra_00006399 [Meloidogyne graminicola]|uniref:Uncharacterized protein n=1 Tax=Meloidogyne graminicola TaxID=189291 RepID=A0A8S9ZLN7_9BILA|nr:hypothetical protein Mgra_00006399 [Meloidogyne graminicola]
MLSKTNYFVLLNLLFFLNTVKSFYLQFKVVDVKNDGFKNINISCKNNQINENLNIPFLYNSVATHIYKGNGCKDNKYILNILLKESNIQSAVEIICKYEGKPKKQTILFTIKVDNQKIIVSIHFYQLNQQFKKLIKNFKIY